MNKTERKNKTNLVVNWPTTGKYFTIKELSELNPDFKLITLRVRLDTAIKTDKSITVIGYKNIGKGRPSMVLAVNPVSQELLTHAYTVDKIQPADGSPLSKVVNNTIPVSTSNQQITDGVSTEVPADTADTADMLTPTDSVTSV